MSGTQRMAVKTSSGETTRPVDYKDYATGRLIPKLREGEHLMWFINSDVPSIIETGAHYAKARTEKYGY